MEISRDITVDNKKLCNHTDRLAQFLSGGPINPITVEVDLSMSCNHKCPACTYAQSHKNIHLSKEVSDKIISEIGKLGAKGMIISGGGEPLMNPLFPYFVEKVAKKGVDITLTTNGQLLHKYFEEALRYCKRIRVSVDAATEEIFQRTHGMGPKHFNRVIANIAEAVRLKKDKRLDVDLGVSFLICESNYHEIEDAIRLFKKLGVNFIHFKPLQMYKPERGHYYKYFDEMPNIGHLKEEYESKNFMIHFSRSKYFNLESSQRKYKKCHGAHLDVIIGADGKLYTCCHFKYMKANEYGEVLNGGIVSAPAIKDKRNKVKADCIPLCRLDGVNEFLQLLEDGHLKIDNLQSPYKTKPPIDINWI